MAQTVRPPRATVVATAISSIILVCCVVGFAVFVLPEWLWWSERRALHEVVLPARVLSCGAERFRAEHHRYPAGRSEYAALDAGTGSAHVGRIEGAVGSPAAFKARSALPHQYAAVAIWTGRRGSVELRAGGAVAVSPSLAPPPRLRPAWLAVADQSRGVSETGGGAL